MAGRLLSSLLLVLLLQLPAPFQAHASPGTATAAHSGRCPRPEEALPPFVAGLRRTCRASTEGHPAEEVNGEELIKELVGKEEYTAILFYASWCPFSQRMRPVFDDLSLMYPQIKHLAVEQSNVMPTVLSRYGVRSLPSILIAHESYAFWPLVAKDLDSLVNFYTAVTGQEPVAYLGPRKWNTTGGSPQYAKLWNGSVSESVKSEPYLAFSILFICRDILVLLSEMLRLHQRLVDPILPARQPWSPCQIGPAARMCASCCGCKEDVEQMEAHGWSHEYQGMGIISSFRVSWWAIFSPSCWVGLTFPYFNVERKSTQTV